MLRNKEADRIQALQHTIKENNEKHLIKNFFTDNIHKYIDKLIEYNTPTGKAYVGYAKRPLMKNDNGIGFKGVKVQSENRELVQCNVCGNWYKQLANHIKRHDMTKEEYQDEYGLNHGTSLVADILSNKYSELMNQYREDGRCYTNWDHTDHKKSWKKALIKIKDRPDTYSMEYRNTKGTCPEQLKSQVIDFIHNNKKLPDRTFEKYNVIRARYGNANNYFKKIGLPERITQGSKSEYIFADHFNLILDTNRLDWKDTLYSTLIDKCEIFNKKTL